MKNINIIILLVLLFIGCSPNIYIGKKNQPEVVYGSLDGIPGHYFTLTTNDSTCWAIGFNHDAPSIPKEEAAEWLKKVYAYYGIKKMYPVETYDESSGFKTKMVTKDHLVYQIRYKDYPKSVAIQFYVMDEYYYEKYVENIERRMKEFEDFDKNIVNN